MSSRDKILAILKNNQPQASALPALTSYEQSEKDNVKKFKDTLTFIGGQVIEVNNLEEVIQYIGQHFDKEKRVLSTIDELKGIAEVKSVYDDPHSLEDVHLTVLKADFAVAENGAVWITDDQLPARVLPFISEYLAVVLTKQSILSTMHEAYDQINGLDHGFGAFIAGPSKTSDIEQSLVLGAHGPKGMTVFLI